MQLYNYQLRKRSSCWYLAVKVNHLPRQVIDTGALKTGGGGVLSCWVLNPDYVAFFYFSFVPEKVFKVNDRLS